MSSDAATLREPDGPQQVHPPPLPAQVSNDGREIWDWASRFSEHVHRTDEIRKLRASIFEIGRGCGDCDKWMKSRECPREHNVNGISQGPSMSAPICGHYVENPSETRRREGLREKLTALERQHQALSSLPSEPSS